MGVGVILYPAYQRRDSFVRSFPLSYNQKLILSSYKTPIVEAMSWAEADLNNAPFL
jgi:hypothetical protein